MGDPGWPLLQLAAANDADLKKLYRVVYLQDYVNAQVHDWKGRRVKFSVHSFDHAFSQSGNYRLSAGVHEIDFSQKRAQRIGWIKLALAASDVSVEVLAQNRQDSRGRLKKRRAVIVIDNRYVVVLEPIIDPAYQFIFVTAFPADQAYLDKVRRGATVLERRSGQKNAPDLMASEAQPSPKTFGEGTDVV
jgi:hypothetical protein